MDLRRSLFAVALLGLFLVLLNVTAAQTAVASSGVSPVDPNKAPSELNHHIAGYALILVGLLVLGAQTSRSLLSLRWLWPGLFILAGLFLVGWSDAEMWPRGNLRWTWLINHDAEALQHKFFGFLLIALGVIEYLRARSKLNSFWRASAFPALAVVGAGLLLFHDHAGGTTIARHEFEPYLINPELNPDGKPWKPNVIGSDATSAADPGSPSQSVSEPTPIADEASPSHLHHVMPESGSAMAMDGMSSDMANVEPHVHHHAMTPAMMLVTREHTWFMIVGLAIALFKFIADADLWRHWWNRLLWPSATIVLGVLLVFYRE